MFTVQCKVCTNFYFNWNTDFLQHWVENHSNNQEKREKKDDENDLLLLNYWCSTCDVRTVSLSDMTEHLRSENHFDIVSMINRVCAQHNVVGKCFKNWPYFLYKKTYVYSC